MTPRVRCRSIVLIVLSIVWLASATPATVSTQSLGPWVSCDSSLPILRLLVCLEWPWPFATT